MPTNQKFADQSSAEQPLAGSDQRNQLPYNLIPAMLCTIDSAGDLVDVNDRWLAVMSYARQEVLRRRNTDFYTKTSRQLIQTVYRPEFFKQGQIQDAELQFIKKNGEVTDGKPALVTRAGQTRLSCNLSHSDGLAQHWSLQALNVEPDYKATLVVEGHGWRLRCWQWPAET